MNSPRIPFDTSFEADAAAAATPADVSPIAWVQDELRRSLEQAHKTLRRVLRETEAGNGSDFDAIDPGVLRGARAQMHQGVGALELVGLPEAATVLRASESALQRCSAKPALLTTPLVDAIERSSFALIDYLGRLQAGRPVSPLSLFPQYRVVQEGVSAERVHPADLWPCDWAWCAIADDASSTPHAADAAARSALEPLMLALMRAPAPAVFKGMSDLCAGLGAGAPDLPAATLWKLAAATFEAQATGLLPADVFGKRVASRLLAQLRVLERGETEISERLAQDLLFFCAQAQPPARAAGGQGAAPRLAAARAAYALPDVEPIDYALPLLGRFDPAWLAQARKRITGAKDAWSAVAGGELHRMSGLPEQFALVGDSLKRLFPAGEVLAGELQNAVAATQAAGATPPAPLAMEVATALLYIDACIEDADLDHPALAGRVRRVAERIAQVRDGGANAVGEPLEAWMEELYRRVSDRQTMGSVVQELRASLSEAEKHIDHFFRHPVERGALLEVPAQLAAMRGVMSVLGIDAASAALLRMRDDIDGLTSTEVDPATVAQAGVFERLASNLGALGFLIDMLGVQPQLAKALFAFDAEAGTLNPVMGRQQVAVVPAIESALPASAGEAAPAAAAVAPLSAPAAPIQPVAAPAAAVAVPLAVPVAAPPVAELAGDPEMREVFIEEAREVLEAARGALQQLPQADDALGALTTLRRAFHTLKGSGRMVGLGEFGEAAWACEQWFNERLAQHHPADEPLIEFTAWVLEDLGGWVEEIAAGQPVTHRAEVVREAIRMAQHTPAAASPAAPPAAGHGGDDADAADDGADADDLAPTLPMEPGAATEPALPYFAPTAPLELDSPPAANGLPDAPLLGDFALNFDLTSQAEPEAAVDAAADAAADARPALSLGFGVGNAGARAVAFDLAPSGAMPLDDAPSLFDGLADIEFHSEPLAETVPEAPAVEDAGDAADAEEAIPVGATFTDSSFADEPAQEDNVKVIGPLRISIALFNIYLNEADELSRRLGTELAEWALERHRPVHESTVALAHSLAGNSATVGYVDLSHLARTLEHALARSSAIGHGSEAEATLFVDAAEEIRRLLHQFAAGFLREPSPELLTRLHAHELSSGREMDSMSAGNVSGDTGSRPSLFDAEAQAEIEAEAEAEREPHAELDAEPAPEPEPEPESGPPSGLFAPHTDFGGIAREGDLGFAELKPLAALAPELPRVAMPASQAAADDSDELLDAVDAIDDELFAFFEEEGHDLLPDLAARLRAWGEQPRQPAHAAAAMRALHTIKGGARLAGAMRLGELAHRLEGRIEHVAAQADIQTADIEALQARSDALAQAFEALCRRAAVPPPAVVAVPPSAAAPAPAGLQPSAEAAATEELARDELLAQALPAEAPLAPLAPLESPDSLDLQPPEVDHHASPSAALAAAPPPSRHVPAQDAPAVFEIDWSRFASADEGSTATAAPAGAAAPQAAVRVRGPLLDRLVNQSGEISITRARIEAELKQFKGSLGDLSENLERLRGQLREIELQGETQMSSRLEAAKVAAQAFDPLEFDRFTRFQELTRMMAESVNDVATVQRALQRSLEGSEDALAAQTRLARDLQDDLLRTRMVEFEGASDRLYRVVRQAAKETGKQVRLDIVGGSIEVDRGVLERMGGAFEHLLRNSVTHGVELPAQRLAAGKPAAGQITLSVQHEGNEVSVEVRDDGAGLDLPRIRAKGLALGLLEAGQDYTDAELANLIFNPGFSTAEQVTELAGRGVGMDVVRADVSAIGGRIETATEAGAGTAFKLVLPLTTAVTQVVMLRSAALTVAVPSTLVEVVLRVPAAEADAALERGTLMHDGQAVPLFWLGALLQSTARSVETEGRTRAVVLVRSAAQRVAVQVDEVLGNQEVVVKNLGPQLARMPALAGVTLLASGAVALIYNPVALATLYGASARAATLAALNTSAPARVEAAPQAPVAAPLVLVVDDSLTVRRVTQRLLQREGYRVALAKDGLDALEQLAEERPALVLSDIEMPRMDGFDLVRNIRSDARLRDLTVIMITSRIAQKHREHAAEVGVDHYLGKPYAEDDLLALVARYSARPPAG